MPVILTAAQARALGLDVRPSAGVTRRATRRTAPGYEPPDPAAYHTVCATCGEHFAGIGGQTAETSHLDATQHTRYDTQYEQEQVPDA
jgi:hypothetical protein